LYEFEWNFRWRINSVFPHWNGDFWIVWIAMIKHKILAAFQLFTISWLNRWSYFCLGETHIFDTPPSFFDIPPSFFDISPLFLWPFHIFVSMGKLREIVIENLKTVDVNWRLNSLLLIKINVSWMKKYKRIYVQRSEN
jgi:hypothetical protein